MSQDNQIDPIELRSVYNRVQTVRRVLRTSDEDAAIFSGCACLMISCAIKVNSTRTVIEQHGVSEAGVELGDWRITVERIKAP